MLSRTLVAAVALVCVSAARAESLGSLPGDWPQWRGPDRTGISKDTGILKEWPKGGPTLLWKATGCGEGYSPVAIVGGKIFTTGYIPNGKQPAEPPAEKPGKKRKAGPESDEHLICLDADGGKPLWQVRIGYGAHVGYECARCTPTVDGDRVYVMGVDGDMVCVSTAGKELWRKNAKKDFGGQMMSGWGYSESPLVDGDAVVFTPGGSDAIVKLNKMTGEVIWKANIPGGKGAGYSSCVIAEVSGRRVYLQLLDKSRGLVCVDAKTGKLQFTYNKIANGTANIPTPVVKDDMVFVSTGYKDGGSSLLKMSASGDDVKFEEVWTKGAEELQNHHGGVVLIGDNLFFGHGHNKGVPACVEMKTGKVLWKLPRAPADGSAAVTGVDGMLVFRYQDHTVKLIEASIAEYKEKGSFTIPEGKKQSWAHPVVVGGKLYLRNMETLLCYDVKAK